MATENVEDSLPIISVEVTGPYMYSRATHESLRDLRTELKSAGYQSVQIPVAFPHATPKPDQVFAALEHIVITIGHEAGPAVIALALREIVDAVKRWHRDRFTKNPEAPANYITLLGADGKPLKNILAKSADDIKEIDPPPPHY